MKVKWSSVFLELLDKKVSVPEAYRSLKWTNTVTYLLYLEQYIDMLKGSERELLITLGRMSSNKLYSLKRSSKRKNKLYAIHLMILFHVEEQFGHFEFDVNDTELSLTAIREMSTSNDYKTKEELLKILLSFNYVSPIYISNIIAEMGNTVIPMLELIIRYRTDKPFEQIIALESLKILRYYEFMDLAKFVLSNCKYPSVISSCLGYIEKMGNSKFLYLVEPFLSHPNLLVRSSAARAYIEIAPMLDTTFIVKIFDDESVQVAVEAADKLKDKKILPHISIKTIDYLKWGIIYKRMVF